MNNCIICGKSPALEGKCHVYHCSGVNFSARIEIYPKSIVCRDCAAREVIDWRLTSELKKEKDEENSSTGVC